MSRMSVILCATAVSLVLAGCGGTSNRPIPTAALGAGVFSPTIKMPATNLIADGSFEKPTAPSGSYLTFSTGDTFSKWSVTGASGNVAVIGKNFTYGGYTIGAGCGDQLLDLTGTSNSKTGVSQQVATTSGTSYLLSFKVGNAYSASGDLGTSSTVLVYVNGKKLLTARNKKGQGVTREVWKKFSKVFMATSDKTTVEFLNGDPSSDTDNGLDCVALKAAT